MTTFAGWQTDTYIKTGSGNFIKLDGVQRVTFKQVVGTDAKEECGTRYVSLMEGIYGCTCSIERFYTGSPLITNFTTGEAAMLYWDIDIYPNKSGSSKSFIRLSGMKVSNYSNSYRPGANLMTESWEFIGTGSLVQGTAGA